MRIETNRFQHKNEPLNESTHQRYGKCSLDVFDVHLLRMGLPAPQFSNEYLIRMFTSEVYVGIPD